MKNSQVGSVSRKVVIGVAVLLVITAVGLAIASTAKKHNSSPNGQNNASVDTAGARDAADTFMKNIAGNNVDATWNMMTDRYHTTVGTKADWQALVNASAKASNTPAQFVKMEDLNDTHNGYKNQYPQTVTYASTIKGVKWSTLVYVIYVNNTWKIEGMYSRAV